MTKAQILKSKIFSPGIIGGEIVTFLASEKQMFFFKHDGNESFLKDDKGKYVKMFIDEVIEARMLYLSSNENAEKDEAVNIEYERLKKQIVDKANETINKIQTAENWLNGKRTITKGTSLIGLELEDILAAQQGTDVIAKNKKYAERFFNENTNVIKIKEQLQIFVSENNFDGLDYVLNFEFGKPMAIFKCGDNDNMEAFINLFHSKNIEKTLDDKVNKGSLFLKAKINVEQRYHP